MNRRTMLLVTAALSALAADPAPAPVAPAPAPVAAAVPTAAPEVGPLGNPPKRPDCGSVYSVDGKPWFVEDYCGGFVQINVGGVDRMLNVAPTRGAEADDTTSSWGDDLVHVDIHPAGKKATVDVTIGSSTRHFDVTAKTWSE